MRTGRPTEKPKAERITIRIEADLVKYIERRAFRDGKSVSEYIRDVLEADRENYMNR